MSDDLEPRIREAFRRADLPEAPRQLANVLDTAGAAARLPSRGLRARAVPVLPLSAALLVLAIIGLAPRAASPGDAPSPLASATGLAADPSISPSTPRPTPGLPDGFYTATDDGLTLTARFNRTSVEPGGEILVEISVENARQSDVTIQVDGCGVGATMYALVRPPFDEPGRTWRGIAGELKSFVLANGLAPGGLPAADPWWVYAGHPRPCAAVGAMERVLGPGDSATTTLAWRAHLTEGIPAEPGSASFVVSVGHDPEGEPPSYPPDYEGPLGSWFKTWKQLSVEGTIDIVGDRAPVLSGGQAIDAILGDQRFANWLAEMPSSTWSGANLFLQGGGGGGIVPPGPSWNLDLFRESGVPRNWAIAFVDPFTGDVLGFHTCDVPCDR